MTPRPFFVAVFTWGCGGVVEQAGGAGGDAGNSGTSRPASSTATQPNDYLFCVEPTTEAECLAQGCLWREVLLHRNNACESPEKTFACTYMHPSFGGGFDVTFGRRVVPEGTLIAGLWEGPVVGFTYCSGATLEYCPMCDLH